jgi:hypothetical protein
MLCPLDPLLKKIEGMDCHGDALFGDGLSEYLSCTVQSYYLRGEIFKILNLLYKAYKA